MPILRNPSPLFSTIPYNTGWGHRVAMYGCVAVGLLAALCMIPKEGKIEGSGREYVEVTLPLYGLVFFPVLGPTESFGRFLHANSRKSVRAGRSP